MEENIERKVLVAFDFDHTVIESNSDLWIYRMAPGHKIPEELKVLYKKDGWTEYMQEIFKYLHGLGCTRSGYETCLDEIYLADGMRELITGIPQESSELIIISDSNYFFIDHILKKLGIRDLFTVIFTNPAHFDEKGLLNIEMYHEQDWCGLSTKNLCKGYILNEYVKTRAKENVVFPHIAYVGDGTNDFCPSMRLRECDTTFPRCGFSLLNHIPKMETEKGLRIEAEVCPWDSGVEILELVLKYYKNLDTKDIPKERLRDPVKRKQDS